MDEEWHTMVLVALLTGMRMGELNALRWQDVDLVAGHRSTERGEGKDRNAEVREGAGDPALERDEGCKKAGLRPIQWHAWRYTFASHLVMRGVPLKAVQELLGHSTIQMTMRYAHLGPEVTRDAVNLLDKPLNGNVSMARGSAVAASAER